LPVARNPPASVGRGFGRPRFWKGRARPSAHGSPSGWLRTGCLWSPRRMRARRGPRPTEVLVRRLPLPVRGRCCAGRGGTGRGAIACPCGGV